MNMWGYGAFESDAAFDFFEKFYKPIEAGLNKKIGCSSAGIEETAGTIRAAAEMLIRLYDCKVPVLEDTVSLAIRQLETVVDCGFSPQYEQSTLQQIRRLASIRWSIRRGR